MTRGDKVREMSNEELAEFLLHQIARICARFLKRDDAVEKIKYYFEHDGIAKGMRDWLNEEVEP